MSNLQHFQDGAEFIFSSARKYTEYFPFPWGCLVCVWGSMVVWFGRMPRKMQAAFPCSARDRLGMQETGFSLIPVRVLVSFARWRASNVQLLNTRKRHRSRWGDDDMRGITCFPPDLSRLWRRLEVMMDQVILLVQARSPAVWHWGGLVGC